MYSSSPAASAATPDLSASHMVTRAVSCLRLAGHDFDTIALALATGAVDALVASGFRSNALDGGLRHVVAAMREYAADLRQMPGRENLYPLFTPTVVAATGLAGVPAVVPLVSGAGTGGPGTGGQGSGGQKIPGQGLPGLAGELPQ